MLRSISFSVALAILSVLAVAEEAAGEKFISKEGRFTVSFPATPKEIVMEADGETIVKNVRYSVAKDGLNYDVGYIAYGKNFADKINTLDPADFAKRQQAATVKRTVGEVLVQKEAALGKEKQPGYELLIQVNPTQFLRQRAFYANGKLYQLMLAGATRELVTSATADKFLDSFSIAE